LGAAEAPTVLDPTRETGRADLPHVPGYEVEEMLAAAGMGVVYRARHLALDLPVALKMIRSAHFPGPQELARFHREARAIALLNHPGIVRVFDYGQHNGVPYLSMELMAGGTLSARLREGPLAEEEAARLVAALAQSMQLVHDRGIIHRDLKPANVLYTADGIPKIADFGLAKRPEEDTELTQTGAAVGTASYMAPEQAEGKRDVGPSADVYALGAILYEALTGRPPFRAATRELTILKVLTEPPEPPSHSRKGLASALDAITLKCLEKSPGRRYSSAVTLADDLGRFLAGEEISVGAVGVLDWHASWARAAGFELQELMGCGFTGFLYRARQLSLNRLVALRLFTASFQVNPRLLARFRREAEAAAQLQSANVIQIHDFGERGGQLFLVSEYVDGWTLAEKYADRPADPREAAALVRTVARAMHYAHQSGVVHCALRPLNILVTRSGIPKVAGFGSARLSGEEKESPAEAMKDAGLPTFRAPEQIEGRASEVGPATDVYGLGAVLYKLLTGEGPFQGETVQLRRQQVLRQEPVPPRQVQADVPPELEAICLRCLQKEPSLRYGSAEALADELDRFLGEKPPLHEPLLQ
jgi:serine/threonine protein kinase